jgi:hypothetical protein
LCRAASIEPAKLYNEKVLLCRARSFVADRFHAVAENVATGEILQLGTIDADASPLVIPDVAIPPGTYRVWVERDGLFWTGARSDVVATITITDGQAPDQQALPQAIHLASSVSRGVTTITWEASQAVTDPRMVWGLWHSATSPVVITGAPALKIMAQRGMPNYSGVRVQRAEEYVAVAAIAPDGTRGRSAELFLPWSTELPGSPVNQVATVTAGA